MDKAGNISENKSKLGTLAVDGLLYGLASGIAMFVCLAAFAFLSGGSSGPPLDRFSVEGLDGMTIDNTHTHASSRQTFGGDQ